MQKKYIDFFKKALLYTSMCIVLAGVLFFTSCKKEEGTNGVTVLNSFGPCPIARGAELRFVGDNLDKVDTIILPGNIVITSSAFGVKTSKLISITVPQNAVPGVITLRSPAGPITTKTLLDFSEPISITSFTPTSGKVDSVITITGDYLNLIKQVIFTSNIAVAKADFVSQSRYQLQVKVPAAAQTGKIAVSNGADNPIIVYSTTDLTISLPTYSTVTPNPVRAGDSIYIQGTYLNVISSVIFGGGKTSTAIGKKTPTKIAVKVPSDAQDGKIRLVAASGIIIQGTDSLVMAVPTIGSISPNPVKPGSSITVTGANLDLITKVVFGGSINGSIVAGGTSSTIIVNIPKTAQSGVVKFTTAAAKDVNSASSLAMVKPLISSIAPLAVISKDSITITGTDFDLVASVSYIGGKSVSITKTNSTQYKIVVPVGAQSGVVTVTAINGDQSSSVDALSVTPAQVPGVTAIPSVIKPGSTITITGTKMDLYTDVIFPGNIYATTFGAKTATSLQVVVPSGVTLGAGTIQFLTKDGDSNYSPTVHFWNVDLVVDPSLVFFDFDGKNAWWGAGATENDPALSLDGSNYSHTNKTESGFDAFFARNSANGLPASTIGTDISNYVWKFDINILEPITAGIIAGRMSSSSDDYWFNWNPWSVSGSYKTNGWITVTMPLSGFATNGGKVLTDLNSITGEFSLDFNTGAWAGGPSKVNILVDNVRFEHK